jgi:ABC-type multidrug transport system ATPase subunit
MAAVKEMKDLEAGSTEAQPLLKSMNDVEIPREVFAWKEVCYQVETNEGDRLDVLRNVSGHVPARTFSAVLGPSGAGKSSLFDVLLGVASGTVHKGRLPQEDNIAYVTQEITLMNSETAADVMWFYAHLTMPATYSREQKREKIDECMYALDLADSYGTVVGGADMVMGVVLRGLSSGQQRRLQIATSMMANPAVMILDEPTTGLDTTNALHVVKVLQLLCKERAMICIASMHQPRREIYSILEHIICMCKGRTLYCGAAGEAMIGFMQGHAPRYMDAQENPADYAMDFMFPLNEDQADEVSAAFVKQYNLNPPTMDGTISFVEYNATDPEFKGGTGRNGLGTFGRVRVLCNRSWRLLIKPSGPINIMFRLVNSVIGGVITALFCLGVDKSDEDNVQYFISLQVIIILLMNRYSTMASMQGLHTRTYWYKERHQRLYNQGDAYIALQIVEACIAPAFGVALYLSIWATVGWGWNAQGNLAEALVLVICLVQACRCCLLALSFISRDAPVVTVTMMNVFGGCLKKYHYVPYSLQWLCYVNPYFYGFAGLMRIEFEDYDKFDCTGQITDITGHCLQGKDLIAEYGFQKLTAPFCVGMLCVLWVGYTIWGYHLYSTIDKSKMTWIELKADGDEKFGTPESDRQKAEEMGETAPLAPSHMQLSARSLTKMEGGSFRGSGVATCNSRVPLFLQYVNVHYSVKLQDTGVEKVILHNCTFTIKRDTMFSIMGPSGSGKTSLVRILGGWSLPGTISAEYEPSVAPKDIGYVTEDDFLPVTDTVYEVLMFYSLFLLPDLSPAERRARVVNVMELLHLQKQRNSFVGGPMSYGVNLRGISGGQKRRVSIGCSMLNNPLMLVLDEPTSGLDATVAFEVMKLCRDLCRTGRTVVATIHQPRYDIYKMFDSQLFLARGRVVYIGAPDAATQAFEMATQSKLALYENPADFILDTMKGLDGEDVLALVAEMPPNDVPEIPQEHSYLTLRQQAAENQSDGGDDDDYQAFAFGTRKEVGGGAQQTPFDRMRLLCGRCFLMLTRNLEPFICRTFFVSIVSFIFSMAYIKNDHDHLRASQISDHLGLSLIFIITGLCITSATVPLTHGQRFLFLHEINLGIYKPSELYWALIFMHTTLFASVVSLAEYLVVFFIVGLREGVQYWAFGWFNFFALSAWGEVLAVIIGLTWSDMAAGHAVYLAVFLVLMFPSCGLLVATSRIEWPMRLVAYAQPMHFTCAADIMNLMDGRPIVQDMPLGVYGDFTNGSEVIADLGYDVVTGNKYLNVVVVLGQVLLLALVGWWFFNEEVKKSKRNQ